LLFPIAAFGWGANGHRLITNKAVDTLPPEIRGFFEANRNFLVQRCTLPLESLVQNPGDRRNQFIYLDRYGRFPFETLPRDFNTAVRKHGRRMIDANGKLPWQIGYYSLKLRQAFEARNWEDAKLAAATLAYYVAAAHDPFNTTENHDGNLSGQLGVNQRFSTSLVDRYQLFFFMRPNEAVEVRDPTDRAFEVVLSAHSWIENILLADRRARRGLNDYTDEYYDRFYNQAGAILLRQLSDASSEVGSYWLSAWIHAGRPQLPSH
jgi:hypothetical protein